MARLVKEQKPEDLVQEEADLAGVRSHIFGFAVDDPANDGEEEVDDDELALAALDALDAIEVFKQDPNVDRKINHARIPAENLKKLVMLLLVLTPLQPQENPAQYGRDLSGDRVTALDKNASAIVAAFDPDENGSISYKNFTHLVATSLPNLFDPLNALFEHFLFSKNIDLSNPHGAAHVAQIDLTSKPSAIVSSPASALLTRDTLSYLSTFLPVTTYSANSSNLFHSNTLFHPLYFNTTHGTSLSSFSRHVMSWQAPTLLLISGVISSSTSPIIFGAFLPTPWGKAATTTHTLPRSVPSPIMFQLSPRHAVFRANPYHKTTPISHFSSKTGIALGCIVQPSSRTHASAPVPILGPISLRVDADLETATFQHDADAGTGAFLPDPALEGAQKRSFTSSSSATILPKKFTFDIDTLEVWGVSTPDADTADEAEKQRERLVFEETEAERRKGINFGGDKEGARALLEMAGLAGDGSGSGGRSGGSV